MGRDDVDRLEGLGPGVLRELRFPEVSWKGGNEEDEEDEAVFAPVVG